MDRIDPLEAIERIDPLEAIERIDPADPIEPREAAEAAEPNESTEPADAADRADATEHHDSTDHREPRDSTERSTSGTVPPPGASLQAPAAGPFAGPIGLTSRRSSDPRRSETSREIGDASSMRSPDEDRLPARTGDRSRPGPIRGVELT
jgi:hypothetical protein